MKENDLVIVIEDYSGVNYHRVGHIIGEHNGDYIIQLHSNDERIITVYKGNVKSIELKDLERNE
jgi:sugar/nucleoside kinase (ribokinase family)